MSLFAKTVDYYLTAKLLKALVTPYTQMDAFKLGIIDEHGNTLVKRSKFNTKQAEAFGYSDRFVVNMKKLLAKVPGPNLAKGLAATYLLMKESEVDSDQLVVLMLDEELVQELEYLAEAILNEDGDAPSVSIGSHAMDDKTVVKRETSRKHKKYTRKDS